VALGETEGFVKVIADKKTGELLGAHIIGPEATEMITSSRSGARSSDARGDDAHHSRHIRTHSEARSRPRCRPRPAIHI